MVVSHGIFSKGFDHLAEHFTKIFTTDSFQNIDNEHVPQYIENRNSSLKDVFLAGSIEMDKAVDW